MITLRRVIIPLGVACNMHCKYCLRDNGKTRVEGFNDLMREFFVSLDPRKTETVVFTGGEPLLYWKRILEAIKYIPKDINIRIISNGTLLTEEMVKVINERHINFAVSWDGKESTEFLRGVDIMKDPNIVILLKQIEWLEILSVITNRNPDVYKICQDIKEIFGNKTVGYYYGLISETPTNKWLIDGFDSLRYIQSICKYRKEYPLISLVNKNFDLSRSEGLNVLPNGDVVSILNMAVKYGTVSNTIEEIYEEKRRLGDYSKCENTKCQFHSICEMYSQNAQPLQCKMYQLDWYMRMQERV